MVLIGLIIAMLAIAIESISTYFVVLISGLFIGVGMLILLFINIIRTIKNVHTIEMHRQKEELLKRKRQMEKISLQMMQTLSTTIEAKDEYTRGHSHRVAEYSALIAQEMGWNRSEIVNLRHAAHLHDIGKVGIPDIILNKPSRLTSEEYAVIKEHTVIGAEILKNVSIINHVTEVARSHHERYDGHGYPDGLKGEEIPIHARIVAVADSYDAMNSRRIYRNSLPKETIYEEIRKNRGTQFDPEIADIFLRLMDENRLTITDTYLEIDDEPALPGMEFEISNFISNVMNTMKSQEESENFDLLTGLPMRNTGQKMIAQLMQEHNGCLIFMDMDNLKKINDIYGHKAGDRALGCLGTLLKDVGEPSVACRLGGDEFLLFLPEATKDQAQERIKQLFAQFIEKKDEDVEMHDVYETYDAYVSASQSEGFGLTLMEAVGSGLPIIGFDVRYGNQTFIDDGENGYRIPIHDEMDQKEKIALLADRIVHMLTEGDMEAFSEHSYEKAQAFLTKEVVKRWISLLK